MSSQKTLSVSSIEDTSMVFENEVEQEKQEHENDITDEKSIVSESTKSGFNSCSYDEAASFLMSVLKSYYVNASSTSEGIDIPRKKQCFQITWTCFKVIFGILFVLALMLGPHMQRILSVREKEIEELKIQLEIKQSKVSSLIFQVLDYQSKNARHLKENQVFKALVDKAIKEGNRIDIFSLFRDISGIKRESNFQELCNSCRAIDSLTFENGGDSALNQNYLNDVIEEELKLISSQQLIPGQGGDTIDSSSLKDNQGLGFFEQIVQRIWENRPKDLRNKPSS